MKFNKIKQILNTQIKNINISNKYQFLIKKKKPYTIYNIN